MAVVLFSLWLSGCAQSTASVSSISLQRTACFGACPVYTVTIYPDVLVEFHGERFVESVGDFSHRVSPENFDRLVEFTTGIDFWALSEEYRYKTAEDGSIIAVSDLPSRIVTVRGGEQVKTVLNYFGGPAELDQFELLIDQLAGSSRWIGERRPSL